MSVGASSRSTSPSPAEDPHNSIPEALPRHRSTDAGQGRLPPRTPGANPGVLPYPASGANMQFDDALEDERRLAYVAMTRAKERLVIVTEGAPSSFLSEAGILGTPVNLPTRESIHQEEADRRAAEEAARESKSVGKPKTLPSTKARFSSTCSACGKEVHVGAAIVREDDRWVHQACAS